LVDEVSRINNSFFVHFVNLLLNDANFVMYEALNTFPKIHELEEQLDDPMMAQEERREKEGALQRYQGQAQSYMQLANETVDTMQLFTAALVDAFTADEIVHRLAGMLDYNVVMLTGPKSRNLRVKNPLQYHFNAKKLLVELVNVYLSLGSRASFIEAVAADGRSYDPIIFDNVTRIMTNKIGSGDSKVKAWNELKVKVAMAKEIADQAEQDFGEVPDEFEDPIMGDLMKDPVVLPSKHIVDRSTIVQHLLSDAKDPFTRTPMTVNDVVPATELKERIEKWKTERIAAAKAKVQDADTVEAVRAVEAMDTSED